MYLDGFFAGVKLAGRSVNLVLRIARAYQITLDVLLLHGLACKYSFRGSVDAGSVLIDLARQAGINHSPEFDVVIGEDADTGTEQHEGKTEQAKSVARSPESLA